MPFRVAEIRDRAQRLQSALARAHYRLRSGLDERSSLASLYREHRFLLSPGVLQAIQRELSEAYGDERRRLKTLFNWVAGQQIEAEVAPLEDELRSWETGATVSLGGREIPLRRVPDWIVRADDREERLGWEAARHRRIEEAAALRLDVVHRGREAVVQLGLGAYTESRERLAGLDLARLERDANAILQGTEARYRKMFAPEAGPRLDANGVTPTRADARWLMGMRWLGRHFEIEPFAAHVRRAMEVMGLGRVFDRSVRVDIDRRRLKDERSYTAVIDVPGDVRLVVCPLGGWIDARRLLHETGHALHYTHAAAALSWEERVLGDDSIGESFGLVFDSLTLDRVWIESVTGLEGAALEAYRQLAGFLRLYRLRRDTARLLWELELARAERPGEQADRYADLLSETTGFAHHPGTYLTDHRRGFQAARRLRGWMLSSIIIDRLNKRFGPEWHRTGAAGKFLLEVLSAGRREDAAQLAPQFGVEGLTPDTLLTRVERWK